MHHPTDRIAHTTAFVNTSHGALAGTRNSSVGSPHEGSIRRPIAPWANALPTELHLTPQIKECWPYKLYCTGSSQLFCNKLQKGCGPWLPSSKEDVSIPLDFRLIRRKEGNVLFNDALNTFYLRLYGVRHMVKDHSDSEKGNPLPPHRLLLPINSKGSFICTIPQTG